MDRNKMKQKIPELSQKNFFWLVILPGLLLIVSSCDTGHKSRLPFNDNQMEAAVTKANIVYDSTFFQSGIAHVPLYVSNGIVGGCFDHMGFQMRLTTSIRCSKSCMTTGLK
ncbi:MAG: hypothetical protein ACLFUC_08200 [Bacteroidales bacterium]